MRISLVTPCLNASRYVETALRSVLDQHYAELEYVVADGGSTDGTVEILERHADRLAGWWSRPDAGHAAAVTEAFGATTGEVMGWLNADDVLFPGSLDVVAEIFETLPEVSWVTGGCPALLDERGRCVLVTPLTGVTRASFAAGLHGDLYPWSRHPYLQQESTFWRRGLWDAAGGHLDEEAEPAADFELWARFFHHAEAYAVDTVLGAFRSHPAQRTATEMDRYREQARRVLERDGRVRRPLLRARRTQAPYLRWERRSGTWLARWRPL